MNHTPLTSTSALTSAFASDRARLVRLCAVLTGNPHAAEDLAQETLMEAWRNHHKLVEPSGVSAWLSAIARNVCQRWARQRGKELARVVTEADQPPLYLWEEGSLEGESLSADLVTLDTPPDLTLQLEQSELEALLDRALALVPAPTRAILVAHFLQESSHAEIAAQLGLSEGAVAVRLHRGKVALRKVLAGELAADAEPYGVAPEAQGNAQQTRIWCPFCGMQKLMHLTDNDADRTVFYCPGCLQISGTRYHGLLDGVSSPKARLNRQLSLLNDYYRAAIDHLRVPCIRCGAEAHADPHLREGELPFPYSGNGMGVRIECHACGWMDANGVQYLALDLPDTQQFWKEHPRMRVLPERQVERDNRLVIVTRFASITDSAMLDVLTVAGTLQIASVERIG